MKKYLFIRLLAVLSCFVAGGIVTGGALAGAKIYISQGLNVPVAIVTEQEGQNTGEVDQKIIIAMAGDVLLASGVGAGILRNGPDYPWQDTARVLKYADIAIANLECAVSSRGEPMPDKEYTFRATPDALKGAVNAGVDVFTLANNHVLDYGMTAFLDTMQHLEERGISYSGAGKNEDEAYSPVIINKNEKNIAVFAFSRVIPRTDWIAGKNKPGLASGYNYKLMLEKIKMAEEMADIIIVSIHWGQELDEFPNGEEINLARRIIDAGADVVIGHHPHVLQGVEFYRDKLIAYSLGNFIFTSSSHKSRQGAILQVTFEDSGEFSARVIPTYISDGTTAILRGVDRKMVLGRMNNLSSQLGTVVTETGALEVKTN
ncbi:MAG: CapA family protein [Bacillota bacterium]